jgi:uncharacterized metal-binding protein YceD (DUF177 family)
MRLDITDVLREAGKQLPYDICEPALVDEDVECVQPITGRVSFNNTGGLLLIRGRAATTLVLACSRCADCFQWPVEFAIDEQFELRHVPLGHKPIQTITVVEEDESPVAAKLFDGHLFDLTELLRQYILLAQPTCPLPPEQPDGRCSRCGRTPGEVLAAAGVAEDVPINPGLSALGRLLDSDNTK